jgi:hypothetical protein
VDRLLSLTGLADRLALSDHTLEGGVPGAGSSSEAGG